METRSPEVVLKIGDFVLRFEEDEELDLEYAEKANRELRETPATSSAGIKQLRELLLADNDLKFPTELDARLLIFLRPCKFYAESAYQLIKRYYRYRLNNPKVYHDLTPANDINVFQQGIQSVLPKRDQHGRRILLLEAGGKWNPSKCKLDEIFRGCALFLEAAMSEPKTQVSGVVVIIDQAGLSLNHVMQFTPSFARAVITWVQDCLPVRLKAVHIVNQPYIFNMVFALFKPFMQEKLRKRIHFHGSDRKSLLKHIDAKFLPERYGGVLDVPEIPSMTWHELMMTRNEDYELLNTFGYKN